jgi:FtsH-binding integral membrane protein
MSYALDNVIVARAGVDERAAFLTRTYTHLAGAIVGFAALEAILINSPVAPSMMNLLAKSPYSWLMLGAFMLVGHLANRWALSGASVQMQYAGLIVYVVAEAFLFLPLLFVAANFSTPDVIPSAGILTVLVFLGLTAVVFVTRKDFSFLKGILGVAGLCALGLIVVSILFGFNLGVFFSLAMVGLAAGYVLYYTSNVLHHYRTDQHVAASLALFAAIALLFWYILRIFMSRRS